MAKHTTRAEKSSKQPIWIPSNLFSTLSHSLCVCVSLSLSRSPSLALCLTLSLLSLTIPSSLNHPSLSHSLIIAVSSICLTLAPSVSLSPSFTISPFPLHHVSPPNSTPLSFSPLLSSLFPITVCLLNTLVAVEKSLRFYWTNMAGGPLPYPLGVTVREGGVGWRETPESGCGRATLSEEYVPVKGQTHAYLQGSGASLQHHCRWLHKAGAFLPWYGVRGGRLEIGNMGQSQDTGDFKLHRKDAKVHFYLTAFSQSLQIFLD